MTYPAASYHSLHCGVPAVLQLAALHTAPDAVETSRGLISTHNQVNRAGVNRDLGLRTVQLLSSAIFILHKYPAYNVGLGAVMERHSRGHR